MSCQEQAEIEKAAKLAALNENGSNSLGIMEMACQNGMVKTDKRPQ